MEDDLILSPAPLPSAEPTQESALEDDTLFTPSPSPSETIAATGTPAPIPEGFAVDAALTTVLDGLDVVQGICYVLFGIGCVFGSFLAKHASWWKW